MSGRVSQVFFFFGSDVIPTAVFRHQDPYYRPYYQFGYQVKDAYTADFHGHMEYSKGDKTLGEFKVQLPDGRVQVTSYEADDYGYRPAISYEYPARTVARMRRKVGGRQLLKGEGRGKESTTVGWGTMWPLKKMMVVFLGLE